MRIDKVYIEDFKNLKKFTIDLDEREMKTVLLGQNATGKSNFFEALILIFKYLDLKKEPPKELNFRYRIEYRIGVNRVIVEFLKGNYEFHVQFKAKIQKKDTWFENGKAITKSEFFKRKDELLPKYVFTYYSGLSNKLKELFWDHQNNFYNKIIHDDFQEKELESLRKLFYVQLVHSYFVLLAYFSFEDEEKVSIEFLKEVLHIQDIESILFVLKMPDWAKNAIKKNPGDKFWTAKGLVRKFLDILWDNSMAPIYNSERIRIDFNEYDPQERLYLFVKGKEQLKKIADFYKSNTEFFKALESTYISKLIAEVRIKVKKENVDGNITFKELSEGEQQLLTVLGLLKFTKDEDSLILLDEPDTHLNPIWKWRYLEYLENVVQRPESTQIIINTHDPLVIGSLRKEEVRIFRNDEGKTIVEQPDIDPRGLGVEGILTSELFGLPTTLDEITLSRLERRNELLVKQHQNQLTEKDKEELNNLFSELDELGFSKTFRDPLYQKFITAFKSRFQQEKKEKYTKAELEAQNQLALEILKEIEKEETL
jgi:ABC-type multidrug transport system ATPase subunit